LAKANQVKEETKNNSTTNKNTLKVKKEVSPPVVSDSKRK